MVAAIGVEGVIDREVADGAERRFGPAGVRIACIALVLGVEPASATAI